MGQPRDLMGLLITAVGEVAAVLAIAVAGRRIAVVVRRKGVRGAKSGRAGVGQGKVRHTPSRCNRGEGGEHRAVNRIGGTRMARKEELCVRENSAGLFHYCKRNEDWDICFCSRRVNDS